MDGVGALGPAWSRRVVSATEENAHHSVTPSASAAALSSGVWLGIGPRLARLKCNKSTFPNPEHDGDILLVTPLSG